MASKTEQDDRVSRMESGGVNPTSQANNSNGKGCFNDPKHVILAQKVLAEFIGTFFVIFAGCGSVAVNKIYSESVTFPGICVTWGLIVMVMIYTVGHVSGAHFNPAITITFALLGRLPFKEVPFYLLSQFSGSVVASSILTALLDVTKASYFGTLPVGSDGQSLVIEIITTFLLMFVVSAVATDNRAVGELGGIAVGMTIMLDVFVAGQVSGASMNPARSIGPALVRGEYRALWVYVVGPLVGAIAGGFAYNVIRFTDKPFSQLAKKSTQSLNESRSADDQST